MLWPTWGELWLVQHLPDNLYNKIWLSFRLFLRKVLIFVKSSYGNLRNEYHIRNGNKKPTNLPIPSKIKVKTSHSLTYAKITEKKALKTALNSLEILIVNLRRKCFKSLPANQNWELTVYKQNEKGYKCNGRIAVTVHRTSTLLTWLTSLSWTKNEKDMFSACRVQKSKSNNFCF